MPHFGTKIRTMRVISKATLVKFWKKEPLALAKVNEERARRGLGKLE